jgi:N-methylhydantoinase A
VGADRGKPGTTRKKMNYKIGVDVGGTFTDVVIIDETGKITISKTGTTKDITTGVLNSLEEGSRKLNITPKDLLAKTKVLFHGTTVSINALLARTGARLGMITTKGFKDVIELRKGWRRMAQQSPYDLMNAPYTPLIPRRMRIGVEERTDYSGTITTPLHEPEVKAAVERLKEMGAEAIAVCFLFSYLNPENELRAARIVKERYPEIYVAVSHQILPVVREFERFTTTVISAYLGPVLSGYITTLDKELKRNDFKGDLLVMQADGGVVSDKEATANAAGSVLSGPASGPTASCFYADKVGIANVITADMGGTSFDVSLVWDTSPIMRTDTWISKEHRLALPTVDVFTIGAGGGSIAHVDKGGILRVGPESAGAYPGPVCYGRGGQEPTVTDANLVLGRLNPDYFLEGKLKIDKKAAERAIKEKIADRLALSTVDAARAIVAVVDQVMINEIRLATIKRGYDPKDFVLIAAGGMGPTHCSVLAKEMHIGRVIIPRTASVYCAMGQTLSDIKHFYSKSYPVRTSESSYQKLNSIFEEMENLGRKTLEREGMADGHISFHRTTEMRYIGQHSEVATQTPSGKLGRDEMETLKHNFHDRHEFLFTWSDRNRETEIITLRCEAVGEMETPPLSRQRSNGQDASRALKNKKTVFFDDGPLKTSIYEGMKLETGNLINGPAIIEEPTTTVVIPPDCRVEVDAYANYVMTISRG